MLGRNHSGFSLMEMTLVLLVLSILSAAGISLYQNSDTATKITQTNQRLDAIEKALRDYRYAHHRLPCPADPRLTANDSGFGAETQLAGVCDDGTPALPATARSGDIVAGAIPTHTLNLPDDYMYDAWGRRITYKVDANATQPAAITEYAAYSDQCAATTTTAITIYNSGGSAITESAVYALISYGANGHGAYLASGARRNARSENANELINAGVDSDFNDNFTDEAVAQRHSADSSNLNDIFDDIVRYREGWAASTMADVKVMDDSTPTTAKFEYTSQMYEAVCAYHNSGQIYCWGRNNKGQLGDGTNTARHYPTKVQLPAGAFYWNALSRKGGHDSLTNCAIADNGNVYCWGFNDSGQLGNGNTGTDENTPVAVIKPDGVYFTAVYIGKRHACALGDDQEIYCWGLNDSGQLGDGTTTNRSVPTLVQKPGGITGWAQASPGDGHTCAIATDGDTYCWGRNWSGELGVGDMASPYETPQLVDTSGIGSIKFVSISANQNSTCGLGEDKQGYCWGLNSQGQLGNGSTADTDMPTLVTLPSGVTYFKSINMGGDNACAVGSDGYAYCWGIDIGTGFVGASNVPELVDLPPDHKNTAHLEGYCYNGCSISQAGSLFCWGDNTNGQLGNGTTDDSETPVEVATPPC